VKYENTLFLAVKSKRTNLGIEIASLGAENLYFVGIIPIKQMSVNVQKTKLVR